MQIVEELKLLQGSFYNPDTKEWEIPLTSLTEFVDRTCKLDEITIEPLPVYYSQPVVHQLSEYKTKPFDYQQEGIQFGLNKKKIPFMPKVIGVLTSNTGSVIRDIINVSTGRNPNVYIRLYPIPVQGEGAGVKIADAIRIMNEKNLADVIILARGGGSIEDLWPFNEEIVARAIYESKLPIISAVGHETDFTLLDYVADVRAATPTAAAQIVIPSYQELEGKLNSYFEQLSVIINNKLDRENLRVQYCKNHKALLSITYTLEAQLLRLDKDKSNLYDSFCKLFDREEERLKAYKRELVLNEKKNYEDNANRLITIIKQIEALEEIIKTIKYLEPSFGGINLEDISAPRCFEIETRLKQELSIPVFHDDQHGTAVVVGAALINALKIVKKDIRNIKVVVNGPGAAGTAIGKYLLKMGVKDVVWVDEHGIVDRFRTYTNKNLEQLSTLSNKENLTGGLREAIKGRDLFIGVSVGNVLSAELVKTMSSDAIVFALANPVPEIPYQVAKEAGARIVGTGSSKNPNQINNVLVFPGIFRGALEVRASDINTEMMIAASYGIASTVSDEELHEEYILPYAFNKEAHRRVIEYVKEAAIKTKVNRI